LVIPASPGVEFPTHRPDEFSQTPFNAHMDIFILGLPFVTACANVLSDGLKSPNDGLTFSRAQYSSLLQGFTVGNAAIDVIFIQTMIKADGGRECFH
jgi:hypothetical protein